MFIKTDCKVVIILKLTNIYLNINLIIILVSITNDIKLYILKVANAFIIFFENGNKKLFFKLLNDFLERLKKYASFGGLIT